ncbi:unnamed protein product [Protopolystoma xenopodis]|uniref:Uncharacterized protein n=1 Tax=Protopolystoma xenopodis TaxID=117903 RepID=A0A3S5B8A7_9PLAT|nr:unnamed protein product [Protopolystoma xenopodis]
MGSGVKPALTLSNTMAGSCHNGTAALLSRLGDSEKPGQPTGFVGSPGRSCFQPVGLGGVSQTSEASAAVMTVFQKALTAPHAQPGRYHTEPAVSSPLLLPPSTAESFINRLPLSNCRLPGDLLACSRRSLLNSNPCQMGNLHLGQEGIEPNGNMSIQSGLKFELDPSADTISPSVEESDPPILLSVAGLYGRSFQHAYYAGFPRAPQNQAALRNFASTVPNDPDSAVPSSDSTSNGEKDAHQVY